MSSRKGIKSVDISLRKLAIEALKKGDSYTEVAKRYGLNVKTLWCIYKKYEKTGAIEPGKKGRRQPILTEEMKNRICDWVDSDCLIKLRELRDKVESEYGIRAYRQLPSLLL